MLYTRHHKWLTLDVIYLLHGTRVTREKIALVSPLKCPAWQPILNPVYLKLEKLFICICGIAKFETGALYITYYYIINDSSRMQGIFLIGGVRVIRDKIAPVWRVKDDPFGSRVDQLQHKTVF